MKNNTKYMIILIGALSLITLSALALSGSQDNIKITSTPLQDNAKPVNNDMPLYCESSASFVPLNDKQLSSETDTTFVGIVKKILPSKWNTADGKRPGNTDDAFSPSCLIYTDIIISVDEYLKNPLSSKEVKVRVEGGTVGNDTLIASYEPSLESGEKVLLYLMKDDNPGTKDIDPDHFRVTGFIQGKYTLTDDGKATRPGKNTTLDELSSTIKE